MRRMAPRGCLAGVHLCSLMINSKGNLGRFQVKIRFLSSQNGILHLDPQSQPLASFPVIKIPG